MPYDTLEMPVYDSNGNIINVLKSEVFKFCKDEYWMENIDSVGSYISGNYINGKKDSVWMQSKNWFPQKKIYYRNGAFLKDEIVNLAGSDDKRIKEFLLSRKWIMRTFSRTNTQEFDPLSDPSSPGNNYDNYISFARKDSFEWVTRLLFGKPIRKGSWELIDNKIIEMKLDNGSDIVANIDYISEYGLILTFK